MRTSSVVCSMAVVIALPLLAVIQISSAQTAEAASRALASTVGPISLFIPAIHMNAPITPVGLNAKGEMAVPDGTSNAVGWYAAGTVPGEIGSAVFDAHVFAAFSHLSQLKPGDNLYVTEQSRILHFVVRNTQTYALADISPTMLFNRRDARRLNLITCAGAFVPAIDTYDHRLVVYAELVS